MRNIPTITKHLLIINILAFMASYVFGMRGMEFNDIFGLHFFMAPDFRVWQLLTYMFMHGGLEHLFFNMFALWMFGCTLENAWGEKRFLTFYLLCGIGAGVIQEISQFISFSLQGLAAYDQVRTSTGIIGMGEYLNLWTTVGASGAIYGILLGFGMTFPNERIFVFPLPVPIKGKWFVCIYAVIELMYALMSSGDGVAHIAHLGGMLAGFLIIKSWQRSSNEYRFGGYDGYEIKPKKSFLEKTKKLFSSVIPNRKSKSWDKNDNKKNNDNNEDEIDRILDKVRKSGYESLSEQEKRKLFERK